MGASISVEEVCKNFGIKKLSIEETEEIVQTGDILLASGGGLFSSIIKYTARCPWSHAAMIIKEPSIGGGDVLLWETTRLAEHMDTLKHKFQNGISLSPLRDKLTYYDGDYICIRRLTVPEELRKQFACRLKRVLNFDGKQYDSNFLHMWASFHGAITGSSTIKTYNKPRFFCSELVALTWAEMGLLDLEQRPCMEYEPQDFSCCGTINLPPNCYLSDMFFVNLLHKPMDGEKCPSAPIIHYKNFVASGTLNV